MRRALLSAALGCLLAGCDAGQDPKLAIPTGTEAAKAAVKDAAKPAPPPKVKTRYHGKTADEWGQALSDPDLNTVRLACLALRVMGAEGRPHLIGGLENPQSETRRMCLENLTVSDLRTLGDGGRQLLVKLAGDPKDLRIRETATRYLAEWHQHVPAP
jgi:hypothetical protein